ncbi:protein saal1 isoform X2 [Myxocyprinus asiaticus]|nr:protein saal1 isoform X2 [Myxocyprinus asiaticus]XP_051545121.1 protein saal1 isoform X2 [Myxocyprinus asiaticus]
MDQNPYPPPEEVEAEAGEEADAIGETMYSKHWLFNTLTLLIQMMTDQEFGHSDALVELLDELEEDLYKVWDMAMDKFYVEYCQRTGGNPESERSHKEEGKDEEEETDVQLKALIETTADFLSVLIMDLAKVQHLVGLLSEVEPKLADIIKKDISISSNM